MEFQENRPIYMQIADYVCDQILNRKWSVDERIPSVREIAVRMEVNPNTAIRAFHFLQEKGILYNQRGKGYFVADAAAEKVLHLKREEFIEYDLPSFYRTMKQLGIRPDELQGLYRKHHEN